eukprot:CAMPEP_0167794144 /NCGR_PEP_ID=MMETSP0111_2-20121227/13637_1 /TAXON_ID=91324 /ORGANISM="Lotharella globosa, Strain CCCM811" /LENGTH=346 /DNA_ID=CAMNT_0007687509 /DNA_START=174 /DNA_END=1214 /DNA_ORIENTATION=+
MTIVLAAGTTGIKGGKLDSSEKALVGEASREPKGRHLVFTSAGDNSDLLKNWIGEEANYDIFLVYYGTNETRYAEYQEACRWTTRSTGSKLQNLNSELYEKNLDILLRSDYIFVLDDDFMFRNGVSDINKMFDYTRQYNLRISMPSIDPHKSVISHWNTAHRNISLAYTNFLEINSMLFNHHSIRSFLKMYDPSIIGWGGDFLAFCANGYYSQRSYAVIHDVVAVNPPVRRETGKRELEKIADWDKRAEFWDAYARKSGCKPMYTKKVFSVVHKTGEVDVAETCELEKKCTELYCFDPEATRSCDGVYENVMLPFGTTNADFFANGTLVDRWWTHFNTVTKLEYGA